MALRPAAEPLSPSRFLVQGLDPTGRTRPGAFAGLLLGVGALAALRHWGPDLLPSWSRWREALVTIPLALLLVPAVGHALRRLNDMGWSGWWAWALALPWARWGLLALLVAVPSSQRRRRAEASWRLLGLGAAAVAALLLLGSLAWTAAGVAAQGMRPALWPGDLVLVRRGGAALPGAVVAFRRPGEEAPRFGRVIATAGQAVAVEGGVPVIDGVAALRRDDGALAEPFARQGPLGVMPVCGNGTVGLGAECRTRRFREMLPGGADYAVLDAGLRPLDRAGEVAVPEGFVYILGDDRDAARDSRLAPAAGGTGLVEVDRVIGRVDMVAASSGARHPWDLRGWRWGRMGRIVR
ncbi:signal peptidase I [Rubellimicrobium aerolatum]|uniref:Signal peptidase I n=1 Tax=Rubellimicrobium aerolatum TaxID=490979 RepID=A0ABW0SD16_9RHOB|nr:signal peptidase I [Rubellimicrobium aerolatum]MBP1806728.1 signal peptidase I [Rubellimicrobium aerolatum]